MALNAGRPDEAGHILQQESLRDFLPAKRLSDEVAQHLVSRAQQRLDHGDSIAGWADLQQAAQLGGSVEPPAGRNNSRTKPSTEQRIEALRRAHADRGIDRVRHLLLQGETTLATQQIERLRQRRLGGEQRRTWQRVVELITQAKPLAARGKTAQAVELLERASNLLSDPEDPLVEQLMVRRTKLLQQQQALRDLTSIMHQALAQTAWTEVLTHAEAVLELAPEHATAQQARSQAWDAVGMVDTQAAARSPLNVRNLGARTIASAKVEIDTMHSDADKPADGSRLIAWIDGVGGYLICLGDAVTLGQPTGGGAEIPILADLSRRHATIRREGEAYIITPIHHVSVDGAKLSGPVVLNSGALLELGDSVQLRFRKPHALSGTAVLSIESHHKTDPAVDGIVLMSESCVLGAQAQSHIPCRGWGDDLVLFRRNDQLHFRTSATVQVDGEPVSSNACSSTNTPAGGVITDATRIHSESFSLSFEEV